MFPDGRRVVSCDGVHDTPGVIKVWDVETGECLATLEVDYSAARGILFFLYFYDISLPHRSGVLPCFQTGGASFLRRGTTRSRFGTW